VQGTLVSCPKTFECHTISDCLNRYIQGVPLLGNSAVASDEILAVETPSDGREAVIISGNDKSMPSR
jgi:hypothetical protein